MRTIWKTFYPEEQKKIILLFAVLLVISLLELFGLVLVIPYVNLMVDDSRVAEYLQRFPILNYLLDFSAETDYRVGLSLWFASFYLVKNSMLGGLVFVQQTILKNIKSNIMDRMFTYYMRQPYAYYLKARSSELVRSITYDAQHFIESVLQQGAMLVSEVLLFLGVLAVLVWKNPIALVVFLVMVLPVVIIYIIIKKRLVVWSRIMQSRESEVIRHLQDGLGGIKDAMINQVQSYFEKNFHRNVQSLVYVKRNRDMAVLVPRYLVETLMMITMAGALYWMAQSGGLLTNISSIAFLAIVSVRILPMSNRILASISDIRTSLPSIDVVHHAASPLSTPEEVGQYKEKREQRQSEPFQMLAVRNLSFGYSKNDLILNKVNLSVLKGETIGIVGGSGAGKTTFVDLLLGLLHPTEGVIECNQVDIHNQLHQWQQRVGYVQQVIFLLDSTIEENIAYGIPQGEIDLQRVEQVIRLAKLTEWIEALPEQSKTIVGERGVRISGGQRQRIGIARALYHDPDILVLDEATSALDNRTEKEIMRDIYAMHGERTIIMIAHRLDTIRHCDRIIVLDQGDVVGEGSFDELSISNDVFQNIGAMEARICYRKER